MFLSIHCMILEITGSDSLRLKHDVESPERV